MKKSLASTKRNSDLAVVMGRFCPLLASLLGFPPESIPLQKDTARDEDGHFKVIQLNDVHLRSSYFFVSETLNLFHPIDLPNSVPTKTCQTANVFDNRPNHLIGYLPWRQHATWQRNHLRCRSHPDFCFSLRS